MKKGEYLFFGSSPIDKLRSLDFFKNFDRQIIENLAEKIAWLTLKEGERLFEQDDTAEVMYIVAEGLLQAYITHDKGNKIVVGEYGTGTPVGETALLIGGKRNATVYAVKNTILAKLSVAEFNSIVEKYPETRQQLLGIVIQRLRRRQWLQILHYYFGDIDEATYEFIESRFEWVNIKRDDALFRKGEVGDSLYFLVHGLLHIVDEDADGKEKIIGPVYRGEFVGEMAILTEEKRAASVFALRDSDLVKLSKSAFQEICNHYPMITLGITKILVKRLKSRTKISARSGATNIALIPAIQGVPLRDFARRLYVAFSGMDSVILLNSHNINKEFSTEDMAQTTEDDPRNIGFKAWLEELEASHSIVLYEADMEVSPWTQRCISQADQVLLVAMAEDDADQRELEKECFRESRSITAAKKVLILIHRDDSDMPLGTKKWLNGRQLTGYHHLRWGRDSDFHRLVRILSGRSIGLVLGGGGAKGMAHIGVLRALDEMGIPIDFIGGTSMGAVVAGAYAMGMKYKRMIQLSKLLFHKVSPFGEFTIPIISLMRSRKLDQIAKIAFEDTQIEDLWLNYFCVSTNLTSSNLKVHKDGALSKAVRTSGSIPGIVVPIICDGEIYVDGSVLNNLPGDIMRQQAGIVIVVDVSPAKNVSATIDQFPSPWKILWSRLLPWKKPIKAPNILDILFSTMSAGSKKSGNAVKEDADLCLSPPLEDFGFVDFKNLEGAAQIGYEYTKAVINNLKDDDLKRRLTVLKPKEKNISHS